MRVKLETIYKSTAIVVSGSKENFKEGFRLLQKEKLQTSYLLL